MITTPGDEINLPQALNNELRSIVVDLDVAELAIRTHATKQHPRPSPRPRALGLRERFRQI